MRPGNVGIIVESSSAEGAKGIQRNRSYGDIFAVNLLDQCSAM